MTPLSPGPLTLRSYIESLPLFTTCFFFGLAYLIGGRRFSKEILAANSGAIGLSLFFISLGESGTFQSNLMVAAGIALAIALACGYSQRITNILLAISCDYIVFQIIFHNTAKTQGLTILYYASMFCLAVFSYYQEKNKDMISAYTSLIGSLLLIITIGHFLDEKIPRYHLYLFILVGALFGWFLNKKIWEKHEKLDEHLEQQAAANMGNYQRMPFQHYVVNQAGYLVPMQPQFQAPPPRAPYLNQSIQ
ncbi:hypothetical protein FGO68_gene6403 [Halteria grandinella]|uniref:DUF4203 domain-containing protein n=1 Tax=Halteria grandinella TaxID=5974 RepID=A0A8J8NJZ9_HALGN|nr:hypothetical protein FGO68_gene6403 [Halteria grandinella]